jgi:hypothetical protein
MATKKTRNAYLRVREDEEKWIRAIRHYPQLHITAVNSPERHLPDSYFVHVAYKSFCGIAVEVAGAQRP